MPYKSVVENLWERADAVKVLVHDLGRHCGITDMYEKEDRRRRDPFFDERESGPIVIWPNPYLWQKLPQSGQQIQEALYESYGRLRDTVLTLLRGRVPQVQKSFERADKTTTNFVTQKVASSRSVEKVVQQVTEAVDKLISLVADATDGSDHRPVFVPDTNALLHSPQIENWTFTDAQKFRLVLTPTVLSELDQLKVVGRVEGLREKAERIIRQIKEYQRRGSLSHGVVIRKNISELIALATEPDMSLSLPWLNEGNADDRLIASVIEVMRIYSRSPVVLVTRDINAQNKAAFAGLQFEEPPDPPLQQ